MRRFLIVCSIIAASIAAPLEGLAQSPNPVLLAPAGGRAGLAPMAPAIPSIQPFQPSGSATSMATDGSIYVHVPRSRRNVRIPAGTPFNTFQDRVAACTHYGTAAGLKSGRLGTFTRSCAN
jgi:hypothetical protein